MQLAEKLSEKKRLVADVTSHKKVKPQQLGQFSRQMSSNKLKDDEAAAEKLYEVAKYTHPADCLSHIPRAPAWEWTTTPKFQHHCMVAGEQHLNHGASEPHNINTSGFGHFAKALTFAPTERVVGAVTGEDFLDNREKLGKGLKTTPGPGVYNPYKPGLELSPAYTFQHRTFVPLTAQESKARWNKPQPGPGQYDHYTIFGGKTTKRSKCSPTWGAGRMRAEDVPGVEAGAPEQTAENTRFGSRMASSELKEKGKPYRKLRSVG